MLLSGNGLGLVALTVDVIGKICDGVEERLRKSRAVCQPRAHPNRPQDISNVLMLLPMHLLDLPEDALLEIIQRLRLVDVPTLVQVRVRRARSKFTPPF